MVALVSSHSSNKLIHLDLLLALSELRASCSCQTGLIIINDTTRYSANDIKRERERENQVVFISGDYCCVISLGFLWLAGELGWQRVDLARALQSNGAQLHRHFPLPAN